MERIKVTNKRILLAVLLFFTGLGFLSGCVVVDETGSGVNCRWYGADLGIYPYWTGWLVTAAGIGILCAGLVLLIALLYSIRSSHVG
jgi:hypothetical protein